MRARIYSKLTNDSPNWILVGNYATVVSVHRSEVDAISALNAIDIDSGDYAIIVVVGPGETVDGELEAPILPPRPLVSAEIDDAFADFIADNCDR